MDNIQDDLVLHELLGALGEHLERADAPTTLLVIGGSGLLALGTVRRSTRDVDVVAIERDGQLVSAEPLPEPVRQAAEIVARDFGITGDWLNPGPTNLLEVAGLPAGIVDRVHRRDYGRALGVWFADRFDQLYALVDRDEPQDEPDLRWLEPTTDELRTAARWVRAHTAPGPYDERIADVLASLGVEDEGRDA